MSLYCLLLLLLCPLEQGTKNAGSYIIIALSGYIIVIFIIVSSVARFPNSSETVASPCIRTVVVFESIQSKNTTIAPLCHYAGDAICTYFEKL